MSPRAESRDRGRGRDEGRGGGRDAGRGGGRDEGRSRAPAHAGFRYRERSPESVKEHIESGGSRFDRWAREGLPIYKTRVGLNWVRLLPPTWDNPKHWGYKLQMHRRVGPNESDYICPKMINQACPICDEFARLKERGEADWDILKPFSWQDMYLSWIIDRKADKEDPKPTPRLWLVGGRQDREDMAPLCMTRNGSVFYPEHHDEGRDLEFTRTGTGKTGTRYTSFRFDADPSPIYDDNKLQDEVLAYIEENPIPDVLKFYEADYLEDMLRGTSGDHDPLDDERYDDRVDDRDRDLVRGDERGGRGDDRGARDRGGRDDPPPDDDPAFDPEKPEGETGEDPPPADDERRPSRERGGEREERGGRGREPEARTPSARDRGGREERRTPAREERTRPAARQERRPPPRTARR